MRRLIMSSFAALATAGLATILLGRRRPAGTRFFIGTQCTESGEGIYHALLDERTGMLTMCGLAAEVSRPTWLSASPVRPRLFAVSEVGNKGEREGEVLSFEILPGTEGLNLIDCVSSGGGGATHLDVDRAGTTVFVANFGGGQAAAISVAPNGHLTPACVTGKYSGSGPHRRQNASHPHGVTLDPGRRWLLVPDMGADRIFIHAFDPAGGQLSSEPAASVETPAGSGPRLICFGASGRFAYLLTELSAEILVYAWNSEAGALDLVERHALDGAETEGEPSAAAIVLSADGRFLYASNRRTNTIHMFEIGQGDGRLTPRQAVGSGGAKPWHAALSPSGNWLVVSNQGSGNLSTFKVDRKTGELSEALASLEVASPTCVLFA